MEQRVKPQKEAFKIKFSMKVIKFRQTIKNAYKKAEKTARKFYNAIEVAVTLAEFWSLVTPVLKTVFKYLPYSLPLIFIPGSSPNYQTTPPPRIFEEKMPTPKQPPFPTNQKEVKAWNKWREEDPFPLIFWDGPYPAEKKPVEVGSGANLSGLDLRGANLSKADLRGADLKNTNLSGADLSGADLAYTDLRGADLSGAKLSDCDLSGAIIAQKKPPGK